MFFSCLANYYANDQEFNETSIDVVHVFCNSHFIHSKQSHTFMKYQNVQVKLNMYTVDTLNKWKNNRKKEAEKSFLSEN